MDAKSPLSASVVMLVIAVFVLGGLAGYITGSHHAAAATVAAAPPMPGMGMGGACPMSGAKPAVSSKTGDTCPMSAAGVKGKPAAACPMGGDEATGATAKPAACPMGGAKGASADQNSCSMADKCPATTSKAAADSKPAPAAKAADSKPAAKAVYVCPMDCPGSTSEKPGKCPKCGMALAKKK